MLDYCLSLRISAGTQEVGARVTGIAVPGTGLWICDADQSSRGDRGSLSVIFDAWGSLFDLAARGLTPSFLFINNSASTGHDGILRHPRNTFCQ